MRSSIVNTRKLYCSAVDIAYIPFSCCFGLRTEKNASRTVNSSYRDAIDGTTLASVLYPTTRFNHPVMGRVP